MKLFSILFSICAFFFTIFLHSKISITILKSKKGTNILPCPVYSHKYRFIRICSCKHVFHCHPASSEEKQFIFSHTQACTETPQVLPVTLLATTRGQSVHVCVSTCAQCKQDCVCIPVSVRGEEHVMFTQCDKQIYIVVKKKPKKKTPSH